MTIVQSILLNKTSSFIVNCYSTTQTKNQNEKKSEIKSVSMTIKVIEAHAD